MKLYFATNNRHKFEEAKEALKGQPIITLTQIKTDKPENKKDDLVYSDDPIRLIAEEASKELSEKLSLPIVVEDAGIFFKSYCNFPGLNTKWIIKTIGYQGILKLLEGGDRSAYFRSVVSYCSPGNSPVSFEGRVEGRISDRVVTGDIECMDYDRVFIPDGYDKEFALIMNIKRNISHRKIAFERLGLFIKELH